MILVELEIEDYKQFAGLHRFTPTPEGIVAIIGHNGAGKTTLFEAVEWCLYQPREINANEIPPRGKVAKPRTKLTLMNPDTGERYVIQRWMNRQRVADAEIFREEAPESRIVQGSRATSDYVAKTLIGLSHRAFVSTFFTRQKELTFFGDLKETERRREVGRLLGMETIREAQKLIGDERTEAQSEARVADIQAREASADRNFALELTDADERIAGAMERLDAAGSALAQAEARHAATRAEVERLGALEREDAEYRAALERTEGDIRAATGRKETIFGELQRMEQAAVERRRLAALASQVEPRRLAVSAHDLARERHQNLLRLRTDLDQATATLTEVTRDLRQAVASVPAGAPSGWSWNGSDREEPAAIARRLASIAGTVDTDAIDLECGALTRAADLGDQLAKARTQLDQYRAHLDKLEADQRALLADGDPHARRDELARARDECLRTISEADARISNVGQALERLEPVLERLRAQQDGAYCPTCGRPIEGNDIAITIGLFESNIAALSDERAELAAQSQQSAKEALRIGQEMKTAAVCAQKLDALTGRIGDGGKLITRAESEVGTLERKLADHLAATGLTAIPSGAQIDEANARLVIARKIAGTLPLLRRLDATATSAAEDRDALTREIATTGEVVYDKAAHETARNELKASEAAAARVAQIDTMLATRPEREAEIARHDAELAQLAVLRTTYLEARAALAFDPGALAATRSEETVALTAERTARDERSLATNAHADAVKARDALVADHERIAALRRRADERARQAGELDTMYREFNGFEQYVADHLTPQLADYTGELLQAITDGKYDQVVFTNNFGIEVFDGIDEHFPVTEFSGGERDVIALCARLALSRLIGGQANNPPGFMVLDEVFGSLDRERRTQVLGALGALAGSAEAYRQLFIISHVDDVRSSPIFDEIWRVAEGPDGVSYLENMNFTGGFEDA